MCEHFHRHILYLLHHYHSLAIFDHHILTSSLTTYSLLKGKLWNSHEHRKIRRPCSDWVIYYKIVLMDYIRMAVIFSSAHKYNHLHIITCICHYYFLLLSFLHYNSFFQNIFLNFTNRNNIYQNSRAGTIFIMISRTGTVFRFAPVESEPWL